MKEEILEQIKKEYKELKETKKELESKKSRIKELEENEFVKEYLKLYHELYELSIKKDMYLPEDTLFRSVIDKNTKDIKETNKIYVYIGTYKDSCEIDIMCPRDEKVKYSDKRAKFRIYRDLEKINEEIIIPIKECKDFERNNTVIILKTSLPELKIYDVQEEFLKDAIETNQQEAVQRVLKKYKHF